MTNKNIIACAFFVTLSLVGDALAAATIGGCPVFPANNYWNTPVDSLPLHPSSATWVGSIGSGNLHPDWGNVLSDNYGIPYATVSGSQAKVPITFPPDGYADESDPGPMPIPANAPVEGGPSSDGDRHVLVVDTTNCILYELYYAFPQNGGASWSVFSSAKFDLRSNALRPADWTSADAAGFAIFPGLVRWDEVAAGSIDHAIRFTASRIWGKNGNSPEYLWPARHWSGSSTDNTRPPMGARFRLKASYDFSHFDARTQVILRAFKKYGLVLADAGSNWYFQGVSDERWPDQVLNELKSVTGDNFEAVDTSVMQVDPNTAEAKQQGGTQPFTANLQGLWWRQGGTESGWGINITHQGSILFATWFTYDTDGSGLWLVMARGETTGNGTWTGTLYRTTGPSFDANPWLTANVVATPVGSATFSFTDGNTGSFTYTVNGVTQTKPIEREVFAAVPTCVAAETFAAASNYSDLWWHGPSESGWGVNITHQGDILFATWFTYDANGKGLWLVMARGDKIGPGAYSGALYRTTGPTFSATPWDTHQVGVTQVGSATFSFSDSSNGTFSYTVNGVAGSKSITRESFASPATICN